MVNQVLVYIGSAITIIWGIAHIVPTASVVSGFGDISKDNRKIILMEWVAEGLALCFIGVLTLIIALIAGVQNPVSVYVFRIAAGMLLVMAVWTQLTGARTSIVPIKICPYVKAVTAILFLLAGGL